MLLRVLRAGKRWGDMEAFDGATLPCEAFWILPESGSNISKQTETATSVTIIMLGYRARCTERGCRNLGRVITWDG
jgi:hypothetical protein